MRKKYIETIRSQVKKTYNSIAEEFDRTRQAPWPEFQYFIEFIENNIKVLDLGCGSGRLYEFLKKKKVRYLGLDNSSSLLDKARQHFPEARFEMGDMVHLDLPDGSFDAVFSIASFHHIPGRALRRQAVSEIYRVLKPDGILILTVWNLFQWKYVAPLMRSIFSFIIHAGLKYAWNDLWIMWGKHPDWRYYHAFLPREILRYFKSERWSIEDFYFVRKGSRVKFLGSHNICLVVRKQS